VYGSPEAQGRSLRPLLEGRADLEQWSEAYAEFFGQRFMYTQRIVWHKKWKYVFSPGGVDELYDLDNDPHEQQNLAQDPRYRPVLVDMVKRMWRKMEAIGDESLLNTHYSTLRTAPIGPLLRHRQEEAPRRTATVHPSDQRAVPDSGNLYRRLKPPGPSRRPLRGRVPAAGAQGPRGEGAGSRPCRAGARS